MPLTIFLDTGASFNIIDEVTFHKLQQKTTIHLGRTSEKKNFAYGTQEQLLLLGKFTTVIETQHKLTTPCLHVVKENPGFLMSYKTSYALDLIRMEINAIQTNDKTTISVDDLEHKYTSLFRGIGQLKNFEVN